MIKLRRFAQFFRILLFLLLGIGFVIACVITFLIRTPVHDPSQKTIILVTKNLPTLLPHTHRPGDSISDLHHGVQVYADPVTVLEDIWITDIQVTLQNAPRDILHHQYLVKLDDHGYENGLAEVLMLQGQDNDFTELHFPAPTGIFLKKGTRLGIDAVLHDAMPPEGSGAVYKDVTVTAKLTGVSPAHGRSMPVSYGIIRVSDETHPATNRIAGATFSVPPHTVNYVRTSAMNNPAFPAGAVTFLSDGWILQMGGHLHAWQGGRKLEAMINGKKVETYSSYLTDKNVPWSWKTKFDPIFLRIHTGDVLTLSATYDNRGDEPIVGAMGFLTYYFMSDLAPSEDTIPVTEWGLKTLLYPVLHSFGIHPKY